MNLGVWHCYRMTTFDYAIAIWKDGARPARKIQKMNTVRAFWPFNVEKWQNNDDGKLILSFLKLL